MPPLSQNATRYSLSPSGIERYLSCPRQYFYAQQLQLNEKKPSLAQLFGLSVHALMEATLLSDSPSLKTLQAYQHNLFEVPLAESLPTRTLERVQLSLEQSTRIRRLQLQNHLQLAFESLDAIGFFSQFLPQYNVHATEKWVTLETPFDIDLLGLNGRIDVLLQHRQSGRFLILDYKTSRTQYKKSLDKNLVDFEAKILAPIDWENPIYSDRFKKRHLQLPFYWLMLKQQPNFKTVDVGLQLIRPQVFGNCDTLIVRDETLQNTLKDLQKTLETGLLNRLNGPQPFEALGSKVICGQCEYKNICPKGLESNQDEEGDE